MLKSESVYLVAAGHAHPERELLSSTLEASVPGLYEGWCEKYLGMHARRVLGVEERAVDLAIQAVDEALAKVSWSGADIGAFVHGALYPDQVGPAAASFIASRFNHGALAFDVNAACAGFLYALSMSVGLVATTDVTRVAVCTGEHSTAYADYTDRASCVFWGDSGGAALVTTETPDVGSFELVDLCLNGDHEHPEKVYIPRGGNFQSDGQYAYGQVLSLSTDASRRVLERNDVEAEQLMGAVFHQSNTRMIAELGAKIGVPADRLWSNLAWAGNQAAAGVITAFSGGWEERRGDLVDGDHVLLSSVGGGCAGAAALLRWRSGTD